MEGVVLLVDDEMPVLAALERLLRGHGWRILKATGAEEALSVLGNQPVDVVLSDHQMPGMSGVELLSRIHKSYPQAIRLMITGRTDIDAAADAVNKGAVYRFLLKPWDSEVLLDTIRDALQYRALLREREKFIEHIEQLNNQQATALVRVRRYDNVTGLPNRWLFTEHLAQLLADSASRSARIAVVIIGIDRFTLINATYGHEIGDSVLSDIADRISSCIPSTAFIARFSGAEFAVAIQATDANAFLEELYARFTTPFSCDGDEVFIYLSSGVAVRGNEAQTGAQLVRSASMAMHQAKRQGGGRCEYYADEANRQVVRQVAMKNDLRRALDRGEFELHYQPQVDIVEQKIVGVEALLRWNNNRHGTVSPAVFVPLLEEIGAIHSVGEWVLHQACNQYAAWQRQGLELKRMAVNLSALQFAHGGLLRAVRNAMEASGMAPNACAMEFEVTEGLVLKDVESVIAQLKELHQMGLTVAIDDFGTGYASLSYLTRFPIDSLKIDRSFIGRLEESAGDAAIVEAIISMAHSLKLKVIAEGVETKGQLEFLRRHNCEEVQGFLFSQPVPAQLLNTLLIEPRGLPELK